MGKFSSPVYRISKERLLLEVSTHTYTHTYTHTLTHITISHTYTLSYTHFLSLRGEHKHTHTHTCTHILTNTHTYTLSHIHIFTYTDTPQVYRKTTVNSRGEAEAGLNPCGLGFPLSF